MEESIRDIIIAFADKYLTPYRIKNTPSGEELIPDVCPICHGGSSCDKGTFAIGIDKAVYVCKRGSCGVRGRFEYLAREMGENITVNAHPSQKKTEKQWVLPDIELSDPTESIYQYFESRKISRETVNAFKVRSDKEGMIVFPFYENDVLTYVKFRRPWKPVGDEKKRKEWQLSGTRPVFFGMDMCVFSKPLVICEGEVDALSLYEAGITNVVSVPCGCDDLRCVDQCWNWLEKFKSIVLFGDNDEPGRKMVKELVKRLDPSRCMVVENYPQKPDGTECKDANEILYFCGGFELIEMVESAEAAPVKGLIRLADVVPVDPTTVPRVNTGIPDLDDAIGGLAEGTVTVFTGASGAGKSTLSGLLMLNAIELGKSVCAYSGELKKEKFQEWINLQAAGSDYITLKYDKFRGKSVPYVPWNIQERIMQWYADKFYLYDNNEIFLTKQAESIIEVFTMAARRHGCSVFLVDNMMTVTSDSDEEYRAQAMFANELKKFANRFSASVILVSHPRKTKIGEKIQKSDVSGNSAIVNLCDTAIVVEKPDMRIIKNRDGGIEKLISCCYCGDSRRIYQADKGDLYRFSWDKTGVERVKVRADSL